MRYIFLLIMVILIGCDGNDKFYNYTCTKEQLDLVEREFDICKRTSFVSSYCFEIAKKSQCTKIKEKENKLQ